MSPKTQQLLDQALQLPRNARAEVAGTLIRSLDEGEDADAGSAWDAEIDGRLDELDSGKATTVAWSKVRRDILKSRRARRRG